jgi:hypothetical protein
VSTDAPTSPSSPPFAPAPTAVPPTWPAPTSPAVAVALPVPAGVNGLAVASLALGVAWNFWIGSIVAVVLGHVALAQIKGSQGFQSGRGLAIAGVVLGWVGVAILVVLLIGSAVTNP